MITAPRLTLLAALACASIPCPAVADDDPAPAAAADQPEPEPVTRDEVRPAADGYRLSGATGDIRTNVSDWAVGPPGYDLGGELRLITSDQGLGAEPRLKLSDVAIVRARLRATVSRRIETFGAVDILAKQPSYTDELAIQGATFGLKVAVSPKWALSSSLAGGPTLDRSGYWGSGGTAMIYRSHPDETLSFQTSLGASATALGLDDATDNPWLTEATVGGMIMIHAPNGFFGTWLGAGLNVPVVHSDVIDPGTRLDLTVGMVYAVVKEWDIYLEAGIYDRGDKGHPDTQLPILDGGFDQRTIMIGVTRRFDAKSSGHRRSPDALLLIGG